MQRFSEVSLAIFRLVLSASLRSVSTIVMASGMDSETEQAVPDGGESDVKAVQAHYLRSPSPGRYSVLSDAETESIFMEPIHLSSAVAAKQIIKEELKTKEVKVDTVCPGMLESAEQLLMEDLYNRVKEKIDDTSLFNTPCVMDIQRALMKDYLESPREAIDEVWPNIFIAEKSAAVNKGRLKRLGITHILNAAHGTGVYTGPDFYNGMNLQYLGIEVDDFPDEDIAKHFRPAAEFLDEALLTKGEDSACARRKQRRMELLEHSKKVLEESQSLCSWEAESSMSGSIPLSAFWPSTASVNGTEDSASAISMQTNRSSFSQGRSSHGAKSASVPGPSIGPDETISIASIQNWIANVVNETIAQKQNEILMLSRSPSVLASSVKSGDPNRHTENDKSSLLKAQTSLPLSSSSSLLHQDPQYADTQSILSCNTSISMEDSISGRKVIQTSKPLFSLFADEVDLKKLNRKEREMQIEMREKMSDYQTEKLISDNKRSTLFKKKKIKGDDEDEKRENLYDRSIEKVIDGPRRPLTDDIDSSDTVSAVSGQFANVGGVIRSEVESNVDKWLRGLKSEEKSSYQDCTEASSEKYRNLSTFRKVDTETSSYRSSRSQREEMNSSTTHQYKNKLQRTSSQFSSASAQEEKAYTFTQSKVSEINSTEESPEPCFSRTPKSSSSSESSKPLSRLYHLEEHEEESRVDMTESGAKRKFTQSFAKSEEGTEKEENMEESREYTTSKYLIRNRQSTHKEEEEMDDDAIIAAWRSRQAETKAKLQRWKEE